MVAIRRFRPAAWKIIRILLGSVTLVGLLTWAWIRSVETRRWAHLEQRVGVLRREAQAGPAARPVLRGVPIPGNAWEEYFKANEVAERYWDPELGKFLERLQGADRARTAQILKDFLPAFGLLQAGARRSECRPTGIREGVNYEVTGPHPVLGPSCHLGEAALCRSRLLAEEGKAREALELILDVWQFGHDLVREGTLYSEWCGDRVTCLAIGELKDLLCGPGLSTADLGEIGRELGILDDAFPPRGPAFLGELADLGQVLLRDEFLSYFARMTHPPQPSDLRRWRYAYSPRLMLVAAFDQEDAWIARLKAADLGTWASETQVWNEVVQESERESRRNTLLGYFHYCHGSSAAVRRERLAKLRLLRAAVAYRLTGEFPELEDPFGGTLRHEIRSERLKAWSIGPSGMDKGGIGDWVSHGAMTIFLNVER